MSYFEETMALEAINAKMAETSEAVKLMAGNYVKLSEKKTEPKRDKELALLSEISKKLDELIEVSDMPTPIQIDKTTPAIKEMAQELSEAIKNIKPAKEVRLDNVSDIAKAVSETEQMPVKASMTVDNNAWKQVRIKYPDKEVQINITRNTAGVVTGLTFSER